MDMIFGHGSLCSDHAFRDGPGDSMGTLQTSEYTTAMVFNLPWTN